MCPARQIGLKQHKSRSPFLGAREAFTVVVVAVVVFAPPPPVDNCEAIKTTHHRTEICHLGSGFALGIARRYSENVAKLAAAARHFGAVDKLHMERRHQLKVARIIAWNLSPGGGGAVFG